MVHLLRYALLSVSTELKKDPPNVAAALKIIDEAILASSPDLSDVSNFHEWRAVLDMYKVKPSGGT